MRVKRVVDSEGREYGWRINCPGCKAAGQGACHVLTTGEHLSTRWQFNGNVDRPTFSPSLLGRWPTWVPPVTPENMAQWKSAPWPQTKVEYVCHSFITDGRIQFLSDCTHQLAGQTVDLPEIE